MGRKDFMGHCPALKDDETVQQGFNVDFNLFIVDFPKRFRISSLGKEDTKRTTIFSFPVLVEVEQACQPSIWPFRCAVEMSYISSTLSRIASNLSLQKIGLVV